MKKSKKGFTLIELLAVIVILAIIALIAVPVIMNILNKSNKSVFRDTAYGIINAGELYYAEQQLDLNGMSENKTFDLSKDVNTEDGIQLKGEIPSGKVSVTTEGKVAISIHNGRYYAKKDYDESEVEVYEITYYSALNDAVNDVNNDKIGEKAIADQHNAVAGIYTDKNGEISVVLLKDAIEQKRISPSVDMTINLGGNTLTIENDNKGIQGASDHNDTITIDGRLSGSSIVLNGIDGAGYLIHTRTNNFIINGGTYISNETVEYPNVSAATIMISVGGKAIISDCDITTNVVVGASINNRDTVVVSNCNIAASSTSGSTLGVYGRENSDTTISNSHIEALSNYTVDENGEYGLVSNGVENMGKLTINNSYIMGTHSGIENYGTLYIDGGTYEGYGHGGIYFAGSGTTAFVKNAIIQECDMPDGYTATAGNNHSGLYIGGAAGNDNIKVYMDNNKIYGKSRSVVLRGSSGEKNNTLYISNSYINNNIRIDNATHHIYIGAGSDFGIDRVSPTSDSIDVSSVVTITRDIYTRENFEN